MKRHPALRDLSDDHHTALVIAVQCKRGDDADRDRLQQAVRSAMTTQLAPHFAIEEEHLLPALVRIGESALADRIFDEHGRLRALADGEDMVAFGRLLEAHVRFEEREVFEVTQDRLPPDALLAIERACAAQPRSCSADFLKGSGSGA